MITISGNIFGFDSDGNRWGMAMTFETEETSWAARDERAVGIAVLATPPDQTISWVAYSEICGGNHAMSRDLLEGAPSWAPPLGGTNLFESPVPAGTVF
jgi:hypothetical protein